MTNFDAALPVGLFDDLNADDPAVVIKPIDHGTAKKSVMRYHYSHRMPSAGQCYGFWEPGANFIGTIIFGSGATPYLCEPYGLDQEQVWELVRIAFGQHVVPVTQCVSLALQELKIDQPDLRLIVSFADENQGHLGKVYQAGNWIYAGTAEDKALEVNGELIHPRSAVAKWGTRAIGWLRENVDPNARYFDQPPKHRYLYPLDKAMRRQILKIALPYPRGLSVDGDTSVFQAEDVGSTPTDRSVSESSCITTPSANMPVDQDNQVD